VSNLDISHIIKWFAANKLVLNLDEMNIMELITKNSSHSTLCIGYEGKYIEEVVNTKFLGLQIDNNLNWKNRIEQMIPKLSGAYYAVRLLVHISNHNTLKSFYYAYFHSIIKPGIVSWGNSFNTGKILTLQKAILRIMAVTQCRTSCRSLFKLESLPVHAHNQEVFKQITYTQF
jgi:hypothetical protein